MCLDRIIPVRRERPLRITLPTLSSAVDASAAMATITKAVADGELTAGEASDLSALVTGFVKALETSELEKRIEALENRGSQR